VARRGADRRVDRVEVASPHRAGRRPGRAVALESTGGRALSSRPRCPGRPTGSRRAPSPSRRPPAGSERASKLPTRGQNAVARRGGELRARTGRVRGDPAAPSPITPACTAAGRARSRRCSGRSPDAARAGLRRAHWQVMDCPSASCPCTVKLSGQAACAKSGGAAKAAPAPPTPRTHDVSWLLLLSRPAKGAAASSGTFALMILGAPAPERRRTLGHRSSGRARAAAAVVLAGDPSPPRPTRRWSKEAGHARGESEETDAHLRLGVILAAVGGRARAGGRAGGRGPGPVASTWMMWRSRARRRLRGRG